MIRNNVKQEYFNPAVTMPYSLRLKDFEMAMQDIYDFFYDINRGLIQRGLLRLDDMLRPAIMSGLLYDMLTASALEAFENTHGQPLSQWASRFSCEWSLRWE